MKRILAFLLALTLPACLAACGAKEPAADVSEEYTAAPAEEAVSTPAAEPAAVRAFKPTGADLGTIHVEVVGVEEFGDHLGEPAIRIYYDFTNNAGEVRAASGISVTAAQNGEALAGTYALAEDDVAEYGNHWLGVYPGVTIRCIEELSYSPEAGGVIAVTLTDTESGQTMTVEVDAGSLPGAPEDTRAVEPMAEPAYTEGWPAEGEYGSGYFRLLRAEVVDAADYYVGYDQVIRFYIEYTNRGEERSSCSWDSDFRAYQDGVELDTVAAGSVTAEDDMYQTDIEPGETVTCSVCYGLRTGSPVELVLADAAADVHIGLRAEAG